jgi:iron complex outermembrane receptor protein
MNRATKITNRRIRTALAISTVLLAWPGTVFAQATNAGEDASDNGDVSQEIIVTAQRREERLQNVPIAISALGGQELAQRGVLDAAGLRGAVPGLAISYSAGINASNLVSIRGVSGLPAPIGASQATAIYLDGVYLSRPNAAFFSLDDIERIEVLRGPQGTLYGRNATAGAINIITRTPGDQVRGGIDASYGSFNSVNLRGSLSGPLGGGLSAGLSAGYNRHDGYFRNLVTSNRIGRQESYTVRGSLRYADAADVFSATVAGDISRNSQPSVFRNLYTSIAPTASFVGIGDPDFVSSDAASENQLGGVTKSGGASLTLAYRATPDLELTSITAYRKVTASDNYDVDGTAAPVVFSRSYNTSKTFSQELRGVWQSGKLNLTAGANLFSEDATYGLAPFAAPTSVLPLTAPFNTSDLKAYAAFAQLELEVARSLVLTGGLRFNREERSFTVDYTRAPVPGVFANGRIADNQVMPSAGINWKPSADVLLYVKFSRGYQAPGFNAQPGAGTALSQSNIFGAEHLSAYEAGIKSQLLGRRVTFNLAGFWYGYKDLQVRNTIGAGVTEISNAAIARVKGVEAELNVQVVKGLRFNGHVTYADARYRTFCERIAGGAPLANDAPCANPLFADRGSNRLNLAPEWSGMVGVSYTTPIKDAGMLLFNASYSWESTSFFTAANETPLSTGGWNQVNARIGFEFAGGPEVFFFGKNLTNNRYTGFALRASPTWSPAVVNDPRIYGVGARYHF